MQNRRTPDEDLALSSSLNTSGGKPSVCSHRDHPSPVRCRIACQSLADLARSTFDPFQSSLLNSLSRSHLPLQHPGRLRAASPTYTRVLPPAFPLTPPFRTPISHSTFHILPQVTILSNLQKPRSTPLLLRLLPTPTDPCPAHLRLLRR
jgi:hypothetical protein